MNVNRRLQPVSLRPVLPLVSFRRMTTWRENAKRRMREVGVTQAELVKPLGVSSRGAVGHYLNGRRPISAQQFSTLAKILKVSMDELMGDDELAARRRAYVDTDLLSACIEGIESGLKGRAMPAHEKAIAITGVYELLSELPSKPSPATILQFVKRVARL